MHENNYFWPFLRLFVSLWGHNCILPIWLKNGKNLNIVLQHFNSNNFQLLLVFRMKIMNNDQSRAISHLSRLVLLFWCAHIWIFMKWRQRTILLQRKCDRTVNSHLQYYIIYNRDYFYEGILKQIYPTFKSFKYHG